MKAINLIASYKKKRFNVVELTIFNNFALSMSFSNKPEHSINMSFSSIRCLSNRKK